jgi:hypothetical protein
MGRKLNKYILANLFLKTSNETIQFNNRIIKKNKFNFFDKIDG